ncbi:glutathione S-transferase [Tribonema minus]|uniref:glutathione transferase n=1 Tax=Tribonema minus TaxID=303371 RepID=A0A835Z2Z1_9STRA|nr:glutathione S-transferase [Tribonema minus]
MPGGDTSTAASPNVILGYWDARGVAEALRCLLTYCNVKFTEKVYTEMPQWQKDEHALGLPFPNLPYFIDSRSGLKLTQSNAILQHVGRSHGLVGKTPEQMAEVEVLVNLAFDMLMILSRVIIAPPDKYPRLYAEFAKNTVPAWLDQLETYLGTKEWLVGTLSTADFVIYDRLSVLNRYLPGCVDARAVLKAYAERFRTLPRVCDYLASAAHRERCVFGAPVTNWNFSEAQGAHA